MSARAVPATSPALWILAILATLFFFRSARSFLIPVAIAMLISYALEPAVAWLERRKVPRLVASVVVVLVVLGTIAGGGYLIKDDVKASAAALPTAIATVREQVRETLGSVLSASGASAGETGTAESGAGNEGAGASLLQRAVGAAFAFAGHVVVVVFLTLFLLASGHLVRDRIVEATGADGEMRHLVSKIIDDINAQIQRYLLVLLFTGAMVAAVTWGALAWMGVAHAPMWGLLAGIFNSIPYFGPVIVSGGLFAVGLTQGGGMTEALQLAGVALVITSIEGWLVTPPLMGKAERMNALTVFLGLLLWIWLWGEWGTILAVPMLVIIKSVADHVERLRPLGRLMAP